MTAFRTLCARIGFAACLLAGVRARISVVWRRSLCRLLLLLALLPLPAAADSLVVVVNPASGVDMLSRNDVVNIFLGRFRQLPSGLTAQPIDLPVSPARAQFYRSLVNKEPAEINAYWARLVFSGRTSPPIQTEHAEEVINALRAHPGGVAYLERSKVSSREKIVFELAP